MESSKKSTRRKTTSLPPGIEPIIFEEDELDHTYIMPQIKQNKQEIKSKEPEFNPKTCCLIQ